MHDDIVNELCKNLDFLFLYHYVLAGVVHNPTVVAARCWNML